MLYTFDLKGSLVARHCMKLSAYQNCSLKTFKQTKSVMKDLDFMLLQKSNQVVSLDCEDFDEVIHQLKQDTEFLAKQGLMDYSILLAVEQISTDHSNEKQQANFINLLNPHISTPLAKRHSFTGINSADSSFHLPSFAPNSKQGSMLIKSTARQK